MLPMMVLGLIVLLWRVRSSWPARVLLVWVLAYPVSDCLTAHFKGSMHALRASPGMTSLILLAALGLVTAGSWLWQRQRAMTLALGGLLAVIAIAFNARFLHTFFGAYNERARVYYLGYHVDLLRACEWLRPRLEEVDAVFVTTRMTNMPYVITLVGLAYDPNQWFTDVKTANTTREFDNYARYGKMNFMYGRALGHPERSVLNELKTNGRPDRVLLVIRPGELGEFGGRKPHHEIIGLGGRPSLWIYRMTL